MLAYSLPLLLCPTINTSVGMGSLSLVLALEAVHAAPNRATTDDQARVYKPNNLDSMLKVLL
jgi:hypothetical protein